MVAAPRPARRGSGTLGGSEIPLDEYEHMFYTRPMSTGVEPLSQAIDALSAVAVQELTDSELHELVIGLQQQHNRLAAASAAAVSAWDQRMIWADDGSRSAAARLANETPSSVGTARTSVRRARRLQAMPATAAALTAGHLSVDHVDLLAKANTAWRSEIFAEHEETLVRQCTSLRFHDARKLLDYWCQRVDADGCDELGERQRQSAHLNVSTTLDGTVVVNGTLDPIGGSIVDNELHRLERELYLADQRGDVVRTASQRRAAALIEMATRSATAPAGGRRPRPLFTTLVGDETLSHLCELANGTVITTGQLAQWMDTADLETVLFDGPSTVVSVSHRRTFTGALRRAVEVRDRRCQHPSGCDEAADRCDVDHVIPHVDHGETSQFNGRLECPPHNRNKDRHDHGATPRPSRPIDRLDELRCKIRWRVMRDQSDEPDDSDACAGAGAGAGRPNTQSGRTAGPT